MCFQFGASGKLPYIQNGVNTFTAWEGYYRHLHDHLLLALRMRHVLLVAERQLHRNTFLLSLHRSRTPATAARVGKTRSAGK